MIAQGSGHTISLAGPLPLSYILIEKQANAGLSRIEYHGHLDRRQGSYVANLGQPEGVS